MQVEIKAQIGKQAFRTVCDNADEVADALKTVSTLTGCLIAPESYAETLDMIRGGRCLCRYEKFVGFNLLIGGIGAS